MSTPKRVILCPGQGAQAVLMGKAWAEHSPEAKAAFDEADAVLGGDVASSGKSLSELCFAGPGDVLNRTDVAQPAIYVASIASWRGLMARWEVGSITEAELAMTAGLSLGEYTALHVAGALGYEDGLRLVALRGQAMQDAAEAVDSSMVALIGADEAQADEVCDKARGDDVLVCANLNAPGQVVVSGSRAACERAVKVAGEMGLRATPLPVAGAFHSPIMQPAADRLSDALAKTQFGQPVCPVLSNVTGVAHEADAGSVRRRLVEQLTAPVRWAQGCAWMVEQLGLGDEGAGGNGGEGTGVHELAPGKTLAGLMRRIDRRVKVSTHDEP